MSCALLRHCIPVYLMFRMPLRKCELYGPCSGFELVDCPSVLRAIVESLASVDACYDVATARICLPCGFYRAFQVQSN